jgi:hypothetical protein
MVGAALVYMLNSSKHQLILGRLASWDRVVVATCAATPWTVTDYHGAMYIVRNPFRHTRGRFGTGAFTPLAWPILIGIAAAIGFAIGVLLQVVPALGQIAALGLSGAWHRYHTTWLSIALTAATVTVLALIGAAIVDRIYIWVYTSNRFRYLGALIFLCLFGVLGSLIWLSGYSAYLEALRPDSGQTSMIERFRSSLSKVGRYLQGEATTTDRPSSEPEALEKRRVETEQRRARLRELLAGAEPITKRDLDAAQRNGWWQGLVLGLVTSVAGSFIFRWLTAGSAGDGDGHVR